MKFITIAKAKKITVTDEIFQRARRSKSPGPSNYKPELNSVKNIFKIGKDRQLKYFAEVHWRSNQTPGPNFYNLRMNSIEPKQKAAIICQKVKADYVRPKERVIKSPGVGQYKQTTLRYVTAADKKQPICTFGKAKRPSIIQQIASDKANIPSVGKYANLEMAFDKSARPTSVKRQRI